MILERFGDWRSAPVQTLELVLKKVDRLLEEAAYYEHLSNAAVGMTAKKAARLLAQEAREQARVRLNNLRTKHQA